MSDAASQLAALLIAARADPAHKVVAVPAALRPADSAAAYATQHAVAATFGPIGGWKVGAPGGNTICGALPAATVTASPARLPAATHTLRGIEAEVAFRMGADLKPCATPYTRAEVVAAIATMHPAIEVLESRFVEPGDHDLLTNLADTQSHGGFVYGAGRKDWHDIDLSKELCEQYVDGKLHTSRTGYPFGDILKMMEWLANVGSHWAGGLKAGQFVTCGSWTGAARVAAGAKVRVTFASLGEVLVEYPV
jgi:2-keto-4-pentenoate hydratase